MTSYSYKMKVSILIPIYKAEKYFAECLSSVFGQTYDAIEYVFVNDATPDNSMDVLRQVVKSYPHRESSIVIVENEQNCGVAYTRNLLIEHATGDYVYFVDSDDIIERDAIETFVNVAEEEAADIVRCNYSKYYGGQSYPVIRKLMGANENLLAHCLSNDYGMESLCFLFIRRTLFTKYHLRFPENINGCEDFLMTVKLFYYTNKVIDTHKPLYYYRLDNNLSITHQEQTFRTHTLKAVEEIAFFLKEKGLYEQYKEQVLCLMFTSKQNFLLNKKIRDIEKYINTFPESNSCYRNFNYSYKQKILFKLAEHKQTRLLTIILNLL